MSTSSTVKSAVEGSRRPFEIGDADQGEQIAEDAEVRDGHQLPHQRGKCGRCHQRQQEQDRGDVVEARGPLQQECDAQAQNQLEAHGKEGIGERDIDRVPELRIGEEIDVVVEPDEALHLGQVHPVAQHRVIDGGEERDEDPDAHEQCGQREKIRQGLPHEAALLHRCAHGVAAAVIRGPEFQCGRTGRRKRAGCRRESAAPRASFS
jgi:hypothetical protein